MQLNFKTFGSGPPLVICHGLFGMLDNWQTLGKKWAEHFTVFILDMRNHGKSPHTNEFSYALMAEDLNEFLEQQFFYKAHFLGHSMGGKAVMQFALNYPDQVDKLVVIDMGVKKNEAGHHAILESLQSLPIGKITSRQQADDHLVQAIDSPGTRLFLMKNLTRKKTGGFRWKMNLPILVEKYHEILAAMPTEEIFDGEVLFLKGANSDYLPKQLSPEMRTLFPDATMITVEDAGHWVHADQPAFLYNSVLDFLND